MNKKSKLPLFLQDEKIFQIFRSVVTAIPAGTKAYLVGGAVRNAIYFHYFHKALPQRDFDIMLIGDRNAFVKNLRAAGFIYGKIKRKHEVVLKMKKVAKPQHIFNDYLYLDIHVSPEKSPLKNLAQNSNFTINGSTLSLKDIFRDDWFTKLISLPGALADLKNKRLRLNQLSHPANLYACLRFMSLGFKQPSNRELSLLLESLGDLKEDRFVKNITKLYSYVGGEVKARKLLKKLGIKQNIFDYKVIKSLKRL
jgi:hypothetical protein